jgi:hypothetical protein
LWNYQSDRQVEAAAADEFVSANLKWMSAFGGKRTLDSRAPMSAFDPKRTFHFRHHMPCGANLAPTVTFLGR